MKTKQQTIYKVGDKISHHGHIGVIHDISVGRIAVLFDDDENNGQSLDENLFSFHPEEREGG